MTQRKMTSISTGIYLFCAVIWTANFGLHWWQDGVINTSTGLFGLAAVCFAIAGAGGILRLRRMPKEDE